MFIDKGYPTNKFKALTLFVGVLVFSIFILSIHSTKVMALSGSSFQAGHIIDDSVFTDAQAMTVQQIQTFLNDEVGTCDTYGTESFVAPNGQTMTHAQWGAQNGNPEPYTCINEYIENPSTLQNNFSNPTASIAGGATAAQIIYGVAQEYQINPEVILVTLQKEQGLVTDNWPWYDEYQYAMGYSCPDSSPCSGQYADFYEQVDGAAWQFRHYLSNPGAYNYWIGTNYIQYNPNTSCGGTYVNIQNAATAALYIYTPYQPDAAALANVSSTSDGGTGDSCSAYGNRNFWWYFTNWFGTTYAETAVFAGQSNYPTIAQGNQATVYIEYENDSSVPWYDQNSIGSAPAWAYPTHLAATNPINRSSVFGSTWAGGSARPDVNFSAVYDSDGVTLASNQDVAQPGQIVKFSFTLTVPNTLALGQYTENFQPILEGASGWNIGGQSWLEVTVIGQASFAGQSNYPTIIQGQSQAAYICYTNNGNVPWYDQNSIGSAPAGTDPIHLAATNPINRSSVFGSTWAGGSARPDINFTAVSSCGGSALGTPDVAQPGQTVQFNFTFTAPTNLTPGQYTEYFQPILEGASQWNIGGLSWLVVTVQAANYSTSFAGQSNYPTIIQGQSQAAYICYTNNGNVPWYDQNSIGSAPAGTDPIHLAATNPINRSSVFGSTWAGGSARPDINFTAVSSCGGSALGTPDVAQPGQTVQFNFTFTAPTNLTPGQYTEYFQPILEGASQWNIGGLSWLVVTVQAANYSTSFAGQSNYPTIIQGQSQAAYICYTNNGNVPWYDQNSIGSAPAGTDPIHLAATNPINRSSVFGSTWAGGSARPDINFTAVSSCGGSALGTPDVAQPGQTVQFNFTFTAPTNLTPGQYTEYFQPILEGASQWNIGGLSWLVVTVQA